MESINIRKYNTSFRKKLVENLNKNHNSIILLDIYNTIVEDIGHNYSSNRNGIFINFNILSDKCIENLVYILNISKNKINLINNDNNEFTNYKFDDVELITEMGHKLTNQEKIFIKKIKKKYNNFL